MKNTNCIEVEGVEVSHLPQSKLYLKIIDILYLGEFTNTPITLDVIGRFGHEQFLFSFSFIF